MKIGVIGGGVVGKATARCFMESHEVRVYDLDPKLGTGHKILEVIGCDLVFVCLPTPKMVGSLACDTRTVENFFREMAADDRERKANFVLRSTVPVGFTRSMSKKYNLPNLVHSPEFLTARCSITDAMLPARNIVGIPVDAPDNDLTNFCGHLLENLYLGRFPGVPCYCMKSEESEAVKLFTNGFGAVTIALWNEYRFLADKLGMDWERVQQGVLSDGRISNNWIKVPGPDCKFGFGGECLVKDLANLITCFNDAGLSDYVTAAAYERNIIDREKQI